MILSVTAANDAAVVTIKLAHTAAGQVFDVQLFDKKTKNTFMHELSGPTLALFIETIETLTPRG